LKKGRTVFLFDVRGIGAVEAREINSAGRHQVHGTEYRFAMDAMMLSLSTLGLRVFDILRAYDYLRTRRDVDTIDFIGVGTGAIGGMLAAALEPGVGNSVFMDAFASYRQMAEERYYSTEVFNYAATPWGIARDFDLLDVLTSIEGGSFTFVRPRGPKNDILSMDEWEDLLETAVSRRGQLPQVESILRDDQLDGSE
jgi:pimeloyl-ACP methyl ester carboxylesterase